MGQSIQGSTNKGQREEKEWMDVGEYGKSTTGILVYQAAHQNPYPSHIPQPVSMAPSLLAWSNPFSSITLSLIHTYIYRPTKTSQYKNGEFTRTHR